VANSIEDAATCALVSQFVFTSCMSAVEDFCAETNTELESSCDARKSERPGRARQTGAMILRVGDRDR